MNKLKMQTPDLTDKNIERIAELFPNVITETRDENGTLKKAVDFDLLKTALSKDVVEGDDERYRLDWPGKKASLLKANTPITQTLRPCREESVNFDTTENLYIEGDNFEVLKILQESYLGKVKMIYIDPPYNTGNDFIYKDDFKKSKDEYEDELGVEDEEGGKLFRNTDSNGRFHSDWLSMMYERLVVAKDLLRDDGAIFVSIDEHEHSTLVSIMNEIFGEVNYIDSIVWNKKSSAKGVPPKNMMVNVHEYIVAYQKSEEFKFIGEERNEESDGFKNPDSDPRGPWRESNIKSTIKPIEDAFTIIDPNTGKEYTNTWAFSKESLDRMIKENRILWKDSLPKQKEFMREMTNETKALKSNWGVFDAQSTTVYLKNLISEVKFENPKPIKLMKYLINVAVGNNDVVFDFFSGSATTADALLQLNAEDGGNRKFCMVQIPEPCDENSEAYKAGYKTIVEIGKERIRRAGKKIVEELNAKNQQLELGQEPIDASKLDIGFRVYKTDTSNMKDVFYHPASLDQQQLAFLESNIKEDRTPEDLLTQVLLDLGLELSLPIETKKIGKNTVFIVQTNALVACFDNDIDFKIVDEIADLKPFKVVFKDASFKDDKDRINVEERFKRLSPETKVTVI
ncbi:MAG: site-specific DNA-methyltransferase [Pseudomonadota bacterium]